MRRISREIREEVLRNYGEYLQSQLGDGVIKRKLITRLELILNNAEIGSDKSRNSQTNKSLKLDEPIEYSAFSKNENYNDSRKAKNNTRIFNALDNVGIRNYGDLINYINQNGGLLPEMIKGKLEYWPRGIEKLRNMGRKSMISITEHLKQKGMIKYLEKHD